MTAVSPDQRPEPPSAASEAETLLGFLDFLRATVAWKCEGLSDEQLRTVLPPSDMTLGGLLKHLAFVEDFWFGHVLAGAAPQEPWASVDWRTDPDWDWHSAAHDAGDQLRSLWSASCARSRERVQNFLATARGLETTCPRASGDPVSARWILTHMIEEYARHCGHADLLRESIDGLTGE